MSREVKFRVWDQKDKRYLLPEKQGFVILPTLPSFGVTLPYENRSNPGNIDEDCIDWADADLLMGRYELEQSTGLLDRNGKEIYEGDIVTVMGYGTYEVFWREWDSSFSLKPIDTVKEETRILMLCGDWEGDYEVIGNIHENPELLKS